MKVILLQDVARLGRKFDVKEVPDGHAQNYLIPRRLAEPASAARIAQLERQHASADAERAHLREQIEVFIASVRAGEPLVVSAEANEQGHLFRGVHASDIAQAIEKRAQFALAPNSIVLHQPLKEVGEHIVTLAFGDEHYELPVSVEAA